MPKTTTEELLLKVIEEAAVEAEEKILKDKKLSYQEAIPLLLKTQYNHIVHLQDGLAALSQKMDEKFTHVDEKFTRVDERFEGINQRLEEFRTYVDEKFEKMFDRITSQTRWMVATMITMTGVFIALLKLL